MMTTRIWLDDEWDPRDPCIQQDFGAQGDEVWVSTVPEAIALLRHNVDGFESRSLDNDLGILGSGDRGFRVSHFLKAEAARGSLGPPAHWKVHSAKPVRRGQALVAFDNARRYRQASNP